MKDKIIIKDQPPGSETGRHIVYSKILDRTFGLTTYTPPATWYVGLSTTTPNIDGTGATEPTGNNYSRVGVPNDTSNFSNAANASKTNLLSWTFPASTGSWGTITYVGLWDAATIGNLWFFDILTPSRAVASSTTVLFSASAVTITMSNS